MSKLIKFRSLLLCLLALANGSLADGIKSGVPGTFGDGISGSQFQVLVADGIAASVDLNCRTNQGYNQGSIGTVANFVTVSRAAPSLAYADDTSGNWIGFAPNTLRETNKGCLVEEARTNSIRNNSMQGASAAFASAAVATQGSGCQNGDVVTVVGGVFTTSAQLTLTVVGSTITAASVSRAGAYTVLPSAQSAGVVNGVSVTGGNCSSSPTFNLTLGGGTAPTNWAIGPNVSGVSTFIAGTGVESGIDYIDVYVSGTPGSTAGEGVVFASDNISNSYGLTYSVSAFIKLVNGTLTNVSNISTAGEERSGGSFVNFFTGPGQTPTTAALGTQRSSFNRTTTNSTVDTVRPMVVIGVTNGHSISLTVRIGWEQYENNSLINATVTSVAYASGNSGLTNGAQTFTITGGTCTTQPQFTATVSGGIAGTPTVSNSGACSVLPASPASTTCSCGNTVTVNLTPTNNATQAFATSPIRTTSAAVTRSADMLTLNSVPVIGSSYTLFSSVNMLVPSSSFGIGFDYRTLVLNDGTVTNRSILGRNQFAQAQFLIATGGSSIANIQLGATIGGVFKQAGAFAPSDHALAATGGLFGTDTAAGTPSASLNVLNLGAQSGEVSTSAYYQEIALWANNRISNGGLKGLAP